MELSDERYTDLRTEFFILLHNFICAVRQYKYCCDHFLFAASLFDELTQDFNKDRYTICGLTLIAKIEYLLRTLSMIESLQDHGACLPPVYNG
jgi:hypothetical protein